MTSKLFAVLLVGIGAATAARATLTENFPDPFIGWTTRWLYLDSNAGNYYVGLGDPDQNNRGNDPYGLWISDYRTSGTIAGPTMDIVFNAAFAATQHSLSFGVDAFVDENITLLDLNGNVVSTGFYNGGQFPPMGSQTVSGTSAVGIAQIVFDSTPYGGAQVSGNTAVTNFVSDAVPEPAPFAVLGLGALALLRRRRK